MTVYAAYARNKRAAQEEFQERMEEYGLPVETVTNQRRQYIEGDYLVLNLRTMPVPAEGQKALIRKLRDKGYRVQEMRSRKLPGGNRSLNMFYVDKIAYLLPDDATPAKRKETDLQIGSYYASPDGGTFRVLWTAGDGEAVILNQKSGLKFRVTGCRLEQNRITWTAIKRWRSHDGDI